MKDKRKYLYCLLIVLLCICMMQTNTTYAAASPSLFASADAVDVPAGNYVNISINLSGNPSVSTLGIALNYDSSVLSYDSVLWNGSFSESDMRMASDTGSEVNLSVVCDSSYSADGTVVTVRFQAVSDSSSIPVTLSLRDMSDADLNAVTNCKVSSQVHVPETVDNNNKTETADSGNKAMDKKKETEDLKSSETKTDAADERSDASGQHAGSAQPDQNYKTGAGLGNDIFLIIAALCGILALALTVRRHGEEKK